MFLIVAISKNFVIGNNGQIPWHLSEDLKRFKKITTNCSVIMGRKTYFSIGKPLINRLNIVVTSDFINLNKQNHINGKIIYDNLFFVENSIEAVKLANNYNQNDKIGIIGGREIYKEFLEKKLINKIYLTFLDKNIEGDVFFPSEFLKDFQEIFNEKHYSNEEGVFYYKEFVRH